MNDADCTSDHIYTQFIYKTSVQNVSSYRSFLFLSVCILWSFAQVNRKECNYTCQTFTAFRQEQLTSSIMISYSNTTDTEQDIHIFRYENTPDYINKYYNDREGKKWQGQNKFNLCLERWSKDIHLIKSDKLNLTLNDLRWLNTREEMMPTPQRNSGEANSQTIYRINQILP